MIQPERIRILNNVSENCEGEYVLYWMQSAQRITNNHALEFATTIANKHNIPLITVFNIIPSYPSANQRHYKFMLEGILQLKYRLGKLGICFRITFGDPVKNVVEATKKAFAVVFDDAPLRHLMNTKNNIANAISCKTFLVETNVIVPVNTAYYKEAYGAYVIRKSLQSKSFDFAINFEASQVNNTSKKFELPDTVTFENVDKFISSQLQHLEALETTWVINGGENEALKRLEEFIAKDLLEYGINSSQPDKDSSSKMSAYLHFGQISPVTIFNAVKNTSSDVSAFVEQLVVRRELSFNFTRYSEVDINLLCDFLPKWALIDLTNHSVDMRPFIYDREEFECAKTHDPYWNAAQNEMRITGFMHNTMRMYWGKKIIEWSETPQVALETMIYLNDKYQLDGRDPNGYAGIAWCFGKHDRPFSERAIFGKVRYMNATGLRKKYDIEAYVKRINKLL